MFLLFFLNKFIYLFIYGCVGSSFLCEDFLQLRQAGATLHRSTLASHYRGLSCWRSTGSRCAGSRCAGSVVVAHGPSRSAACGIFPDQGSNPCPLHCQADSQPLHHQGSPNSLSFLIHTHFRKMSSGELMSFCIEEELVSTFQSCLLF